MISSFKGKYRFLSNFWPAEVWLDGLKYPTTEHAYQAAKTLDQSDREKIRLAETAGQAKKLGRKIIVREDWDQVKLRVMEDLLRQKFQIPELKQLLQDTKPVTLTEGNTWGDTFWGVSKGVGHNHLGRLLMEIRDGS